LVLEEVPGYIPDYNDPHRGTEVPNIDISDVVGFTLFDKLFITLGCIAGILLIIFMIKCLTLVDFTKLRRRANYK